jgi:hypothetical protein
MMPITAVRVKISRFSMKILSRVGSVERVGGVVAKSRPIRESSVLAWRRC